MNSTTQYILDKAAAGERLSFDEGVALFDCKDLNRLGQAATAVTKRLHPEPFRTYNIDRNINYTNVCAAVCDFCAFFRKSGAEDAYVLPREELFVLRSACSADIRTLCAGVAPGGGRIMQCISNRAASLSPACKDVLVPFMVR